MGAWGTGPFENDTASDWAYGLEECQDFSLIEQTLAKVLEADKELDASEAEEAIAAAQTLALLRSRVGRKCSDNEVVDQWVKQIKLIPTTELMQTAQKALARVQTNPSELLELWQETEDFEEWEATLLDLRKHLSGE